MNQTTLELPPRRLRDGQAMTIVRSQTSAEILVQMGFPKHRVEKALAATGDKGVQVASDWLLSHVNDPLIDDNSPREYTLYLCPVGKLQQRLLELWNTTYQECGWNGAHNCFPHITLTPFFKVENRLVSQLSHVLRKVTETLPHPPDQVALELFTSYRYIGLFMNEKHEQFFHSIVKQFISQVEKLGIKIVFHEKQFHLSMAYHFSEDKEGRLNDLARSLDLHLPARWDIRLYSRVPISANYQVRRVLFPYTSAACDELELTPGDFLYVKQVDVMNSDDGWAEGLSWLTGCSGVFPLIYSERTAETETWTMHMSIPVIGADLNIESSFSNFENKVSVMNQLLATKSHQLTSPVTYSTMPCSLSCHNDTNSCSSNSCNKKNNSSSNIHNNSSNNNDHSDLKTTRLNDLCQHKQHLSNKNITKTTTKNVATTKSNTTTTTTASNVVKPPIAVFTTKNKSKEVSKPAHSRVTNNTNNNINNKNNNDTSNATHSSSNINNKTSILPQLKPQQPSHQASSNTDQPINTKIINNNTNNSNNNFNNNLFQNNLSNNTPNNTQTPSNNPLSISKNPTPLTPVTTNSLCCYNSMDIFSSSSGKLVTMRGPRQLYVIKHGESIESTFGKDWVANSFNQGKYTRYDLNMPLMLPVRDGGPMEFLMDSPLTVQGSFQATMLGKSLKEKQVYPAYVYSSPALKCVQSAVHLMEALGLDLKIRVETGLYEWLNHHNQQQKSKKLPRFMTHAELSKQKYPIDTAYKESVSFGGLFEAGEEHLEGYYGRLHRVTKEILKKHDSEGVDIVFMTHTGNLDGCTRLLTGQRARSTRGYQDLSRKVPYCAVCLAREALTVPDAWYLVEPPILPFAHSNNPKYNWTALTISSLS